jgi:hypothetical protein
MLNLGCEDDGEWGYFSRIVRGIFAQTPNFGGIWGKNCPQQPKKGELMEK